MLMPLISPCLQHCHSDIDVDDSMMTDDGETVIKSLNRAVDDSVGGSKWERNIAVGDIATGVSNINVLLDYCCYSNYGDDFLERLYMFLLPL